MHVHLYSVGMYVHVCVCVLVRVCMHVCMRSSIILYVVERFEVRGKSARL